MNQDLSEVLSKHILLVEDNPGDVELTREAFKVSKVPCEFTVATDGEKAINLLYDACKNKLRLPDVILLDINMPKKNGFEVLATVKKSDVLKSIPVIMLTTSESQKDVEKCYELQANSYLTKPIDMANFFEMVETFEDFWLKTVKLPV